MRTFMNWALVLTVPAFFVPAISAEEPIVPQGTTLKLILLRQKSVQEELKLTPELKTKILAFTEKQHDAFVESKKQGGAALKLKHDSLETENVKFLTETLSATQLKRLNQIAMQIAALHYLLMPEKVAGLKLSEEQVGKLRAIQVDAHKSLDGLLASKEGRHEKLAKLREETRGKIIGVLTDAQKAQAQELAGAPFTGEIVLED